MYDDEANDVLQSTRYTYHWRIPAAFWKIMIVVLKGVIMVPYMWKQVWWWSRCLKVQCKQIGKKQWREECLRYTTVADQIYVYLVLCSTSFASSSYMFSHVGDHNNTFQHYIHSISESSRNPPMACMTCTLQYVHHWWCKRCVFINRHRSVVLSGPSGFLHQ
jgi:hypothetical protein